MNDKRFILHSLSADSSNRWDWAMLPLVLAAFSLLALAASQMALPFHLGEVLSISLDPWVLPYYLLRTTLRMFLALAASVLFACVFAALAAKSRTAEKVLVPLLDILQSIPILGFLSITVTAFIGLFPGSLLVSLRQICLNQSNSCGGRRTRVVGSEFSAFRPLTLCCGHG